MIYHIPVLLNEVVESLHIIPGKKYIDATFGGGGHGFEILKRGGIVLGIDQDTDAIEFVQQELKVQNSKLKIGEENLRLVQGNFRDIQRIAKENGFESVAGILFDLGFSSHQIERSGRGFSFLRDEPLDMRMNTLGGLEEGTTAAHIVNTCTEDQLYEIFSKLGEERNARVIARYIVSRRSVEKIVRSKQLADIVAECSPKNGLIHPATRVFQALRIAVNDELAALKEGLSGGLTLLEKKGRFAVITFHSLEDRIVKNSFREWERKGMGRVLTKKPIEARDKEVEKNRRSRSARLRLFEKN